MSSFWGFVIPVTTTLTSYQLVGLCHGGRDTGWKCKSSWRWFCSPEWDEWELIRLQAKPSALTNQLKIGDELHNW